MGNAGRPGGPQLARVIGIAASAAAIGCALLAAGSSSAGAEETNLRAAGDGTGPLEATIQRDTHGIPHISAENFGGIGFGYGYAFAEDNICTIAESYVTVRAERSRYAGNGVEGSFGPSGSYPQRGNGAGADNLSSDVFYQRIIDKGIIEDLLASDDPATAPAPEIREGVRGYVAGYNKYLADTGVANLPDPRCAGKPWVKPIEEIDAYRRFYQLALLASQTVAINGIGGENDPGNMLNNPSGFDPGDFVDQLEDLLPIGGIGSNAYGLGSEATDNGKGIVLGNPHFPWDGPERFYQSHLTIPGEVNVSGASLFGVPLVLIGHTDNMAWSHTVSTAFRFTPFELKLNPADPTQYEYDGELRDMTEDQVTVMARNGSGQLEPVTRTVYSTHHGPVITDLLGLGLPWTPTTAYAMGDANAANFRYLNHFFEVNQAQSVQELDDIEEEFQGIPWVNTIAADSSGEAYYADIGAVPNVPNTKVASCPTVLGAVTFGALGLPTLDGSLSECEWDTDDDAVAPGIFGYENMPKLFRDDYVTNSNDSYWLSNPEEPLEGYARIIGDESSERALRTRIGVKMLQEHWTGDQLGDADDPLNAEDIRDIVFNNRQYAGELWRDTLVTYCTTASTAGGGFLLGSNGQVEVGNACTALAGWNLKDDLTSTGAVLFRRFATKALASIGGLVGNPTPFLVPFSPTDPVNTPNGLNVSHPQIEQWLADSIQDLRNAGIPFDAPLGDWQYEQRGAQRIPIHGGPGGLGVFNAISSIYDSSPPDSGYRDIVHGSSFVMVTQFKDTSGGECGADDRSILTYSQSANPDSPYWKDQTEMYSQKQWVNPPFCADEVAAAGLDETIIEGCMPGGCGDPADTDSDGIPDQQDVCPLTFGTPSNLGCPEPSPQDADGDQLPDAQDLCPTEPGPAESGGCPVVTAPGPSGGASGSVPGEIKGCAESTRTGTARRDVLRGTPQAERLLGLRGRDDLNGMGGDDCLFGGRGRDLLTGGAGGDLVRGGGGRDVIHGAGGPDVLAGGRGADSIEARDGERDVIRCGKGRDEYGADARDRVIGCEDESLSPPIPPAI